VRKPNFFIVGAPKCGTTSLWSYLKAHPEIFMSTEKELFFFDSDLRANAASAPSLKQYLRHFCSAGDVKRVGEATASYLRSQQAPKAIKAFSPAAQIIIMLRNPVDVMYSLYGSALYGLEPITDFETALAADARRGDRERIGYREFTDFPKQVQRYLDLFGGENVHTIIFDDLKQDPAAVYQNTLRFLGVRLGFNPEFVVMSANESVRNIRLQRALVHPPRALRSIGAALVPSELRSRIRRTLLNCNLQARPRPPMDAELRRRLQKEFEPKVEQLSKLLRRDLSGWDKDPNGESADRK
jgi:Sulfotransferase domain